MSYKYTIWLQFLSLSLAEDIFQQNIGDRMEIGVSEKGYKKAELSCGSDSMVVNLETEDDFSGVIYTRGSFYDKDKESPCFLDMGNMKGRKSFRMKFSLNECKTIQEGSKYSNVLVVQNDKELIMPGDAAFNLECDFSKPRDVKVTAGFLSENPVVSRITLTDADPSSRSINSRFTVESYMNSVIISPEILRRKEEL